MSAVVASKTQLQHNKFKALKIGNLPPSRYLDSNRIKTNSRRNLNSAMDVRGNPGYSQIDTQKRLDELKKKRYLSKKKATNSGKRQQMRSGQL